MNIIEEITLDLTNINHKVINAKQGDNNSRQLKIWLAENGKQIALETTDKVKCRLKKANNKTYTSDCTKNDDNSVTLALTNQHLSCAGLATADISVENGESILSTFSFMINVQSTATGNTAVDEDIIASAEQALERIEQAVHNVENEYATKSELNQQSEELSAAKSDIAANTNSISQNTTDIRNCHFYYSTVASPANIDTVNHKITIERLVVMTMISGSIWIDNVDLAYDPTWWIACVYFDYDETDTSKMLKICQHSDLPKKNIDVVMSFPARESAFAKYAHAKFTFVVDGK